MTYFLRRTFSPKVDCERGWSAWAGSWKTQAEYDVMVRDYTPDLAGTHEDPGCYTPTGCPERPWAIRGYPGLCGYELLDGDDPFTSQEGALAAAKSMIQVLDAADCLGGDEWFRDCRWICEVEPSWHLMEGEW